MNNSINTLVLSDIVDKYTTEYGMYIIDEMFPNYIDNLKIVIRRALWALKSFYPKYISSQNALSNTFRYHIHNPDAIYDAMIRTTQDFSIMYPLFELKGDKGSYSGDRPAAYRYTEIKISDFGYDVYFRNINPKVLTFKSSEDFSNKEPAFLIPRIPIGLVMYNYCIGFGFTSKTISYSLTSMLDLLKLYLDKKDNLSFSDERREFKEIVNRKFQYTFPIRNRVLNRRNPTILEGEVDFSNNCSLVINNLPYGQNFNVFEEKMLSTLLKDKNISSILPLSSEANNAKLVISVKYRDRYKILSNLLNKIKIVEEFKPYLSFSKNGNIAHINNELGILENWYNIRRQSIIDQIKLDIADHKFNILKYNSYILVTKYLEDIKQILSNSSDDKESRIRLKSFFNDKGEKITLQQSEVILNTRLKVLNRLNTQSLYERLNDSQKKIDESYDKIRNIDSLILKENEDIVKKYERKDNYISYIPKYIGYVVVNDSFSIWVEDIKKLEYYLNIFNNDITDVVITNRPYPKIGYTSNTSYITLYEIPTKVGNRIIRYVKNVSTIPHILTVKKYHGKIEPKIVSSELSYKIDIPNRSFDIINIYKKNKDLYIKRMKINKSDDISKKVRSSIYVKNTNIHKEYLVFYWLSDDPKKVRVKYINIDIHKKIPIRYGEDVNVIILDVVPVTTKSKNGWYPINTRNTFTTLPKSFVLVDLDKIISTVIKEPGRFKTITLSRFLYST